MVYLLEICKVTTTIFTKGVLKIGIRSSERSYIYEFQRVTSITFSTIGVKLVFAVKLGHSECLLEGWVYRSNV